MLFNSAQQPLPAASATSTPLQQSQSIFGDATITSTLTALNSSAIAAPTTSSQPQLSTLRGVVYVNTAAHSIAAASLQPPQPALHVESLATVSVATTSQQCASVAASHSIAAASLQPPQPALLLVESLATVSDATTLQQCASVAASHSSAAATLQPPQPAFHVGGLAPVSDATATQQCASVAAFHSSAAATLQLLCSDRSQHFLLRA